MVTQQLSDFVRDQRTKGVLDEVIKENMMKVGWSENDVDQVLNPNFTSQQIQAQPTPSPVETKVSKRVLVSYFLTSAIFNIIGALVALVFILRNRKEVRKPRFIALALGFVPAIILILISSFGGSKISQALISKYPEMGYLPLELKRDYPNGEFSVNVNFSKDLGTGKTTSVITVGIIGKEAVSADDRKKIGMKVCDLLSQNSTAYDNVEVEQIQRTGFAIFHFDKSIVEGRTCEEWKLNPAQEIHFP